MTVVHLAGRHTNERQSFLHHRESFHSVLLTNSKQVDVFELPLCIGDAYCDSFPAAAPSFLRIDDSGFRLASRQSVVIEAAEEIEVPYNMFGVIFPKGTLATVNGVVVPTTKIDPGFRGFLRILVTNTSSRTYVLRQGDVFASAVFLATSLTVEEPITSPKEDIIPNIPPWKLRAKRWIRSHAGSILVPLLSAFIGGLFTLVATWLTLRGKS